MSIAAGAVEKEDGIVGVALCVAMRLAEGEVVKVKFGEGLAGLEVEVGDVEAAVLGGPVGGSLIGLGLLGSGSLSDCE